MNGTLLRNILVAAVGLIVIGAVWLGLKGMRAPGMFPPQQGATSTPGMPDGNATDTPSAATMTVKVALLDYTASKPGVSRGCDRVVLVDRTVPASPAPLTAALTELFAMPETQVGDLNSFIPKTRSTLGFDYATVQDGVARIYLLGRLSNLAGVCDDPRAKAQIEETALQFPTVQRVELYLNGERTNLQPDQRG